MAYAFLSFWNFFFLNHLNYFTVSLFLVCAVEIEWWHSIPSIRFPSDLLLQTGLRGLLESIPVFSGSRHRYALNESPETNNMVCVSGGPTAGRHSRSSNTHISQRLSHCLLTGVIITFRFGLESKRPSIWSDVTLLSRFFHVNLTRSLTSLRGSSAMPCCAFLFSQ